MNIAKFLRTSILKNICKWLLPKVWSQYNNCIMLSLFWNILAPSPSQCITFVFSLFIIINVGYWSDPNKHEVFLSLKYRLVFCRLLFYDRYLQPFFEIWRSGIIKHVLRNRSFISLKISQELWKLHVLESTFKSHDAGKIDKFLETKCSSMLELNNFGLRKTSLIKLVISIWKTFP